MCNVGKVESNGEIVKEPTFSDFMAGKRAIWIRHEGLRVYLRHARRFINGEMYATLDIASAEADREGQGEWKRFVVFLQGEKALDEFEYVHVELVHNKRVREWFRKHAWVPYRASDDEVSYIMPVSRFKALKVYG